MKTLIDLAYDDIVKYGVVSDATIALAAKSKVKTRELKVFCDGASAMLDHKRKHQQVNDLYATRGGRV